MTKILDLVLWLFVWCYRNRYVDSRSRSRRSVDGGYWTAFSFQNLAAGSWFFTLYNGGDSILLSNITIGIAGKY